MIQESKQTREEKEKMYNKFTKKELINMIISANNFIEMLKPEISTGSWAYKDDTKVPYHTICSCNPVNGGSGVCGCTMANELVDRIGLKSNMKTTIKTNV